MKWGEAGEDVTKGRPSRTAEGGGEGGEEGGGGGGRPASIKPVGQQ